MLVDPDGKQRKLFLQRVGQERAAKNRVHTRWVVMADREGNDLCVRNAGRH